MPVVPPDLEEKIERNVSFRQVKTSPLSYNGKFVVVGGIVLSVKPLKQDGTRIEVLQLPVANDHEPQGRLTDSNGRFLAFHKEFLDPATIPTGTRVTVVGEVTGSMMLMLDEVDYAYPTLNIGVADNLAFQDARLLVPSLFVLRRLLGVVLGILLGASAVESIQRAW